MRGPKGQCNRFVASCFCNVSLEWTISIIQQNDTYFPDAEWFAARETTLTGKIYWIFLCVFVCYSLYCPVCKYIYIFQSILYSFSVILSPVKNNEGHHGCWLKVIPTASITGLLVSTNHFFVFGANRRSMRMTCFMKKMRYMEKNMRNGHAWSGSEVNAQF